jgi:polyisoprenoid-binding protein YceI
MQQPIRVLTVVLGALALLASAALAKTDNLALASGSKLWLTGSSTLHEFTCKASKLSATFDLDAERGNAAGGDAVVGLIRAKAVHSMVVIVDVAGLHSGKDGLDRNMYKALQADKHPRIRFRMAGYDLSDVGPSHDMNIDAQGTLEVAGVEREIHVVATARREGDRVRMTGSAPLRMTQFNIKPPTMMMGAMRTSDAVVVHFDLVIGEQDEAGDMSRAE